jgi:catechol 2,3-dioxygenase-like lactoylglutathione lyase family enzyme
MKTFDNLTTTTGVARRVWLTGCLMLTGLGLVLGFNPGRTIAQPGASTPKSEGATGKRLNHIDLVVADVAENRAFFEKHFGFRKIVDFGDKLAVLTDGAGFTLTLSSPELGDEIGTVQRGGADSKNKGADAPNAQKQVEYPAGFHIGFHQDSKEGVDEIHKKLKAAGVNVPEPQDYHGAWTFYVRAPGGFYVEVFHQSRRGR